MKRSTWFKRIDLPLASRDIEVETAGGEAGPADIQVAFQNVADEMLLAFYNSAIATDQPVLQRGGNGQPEAPVAGATRAEGVLMDSSLTSSCPETGSRETPDIPETCR